MTPKTVARDVPKIDLHARSFLAMAETRWQKLGFDAALRDKLSYLFSLHP